MPVWHDATRQLVKDGRLVILGVTQEQHPERCRLFAQWKQFDWPILHDPINVLESAAVPIVVAIDEHGIVRSTRPRPRVDREGVCEQGVHGRRNGRCDADTLRPALFVRSRFASVYRSRFEFRG